MKFSQRFDEPLFKTYFDSSQTVPLLLSSFLREKQIDVNLFVVSRLLIHYSCFSSIATVYLKVFTPTCTAVCWQTLGDKCVHVNPPLVDPESKEYEMEAQDSKREH